MLWTWQPNFFLPSSKFQGGVVLLITSPKKSDYNRKSSILQTVLRKLLEG